MNNTGANIARARRIRLTQLRQELLSPVNALLGYAEVLQEKASRKGPSGILPDMNRILGAARDLAGKVERLVDDDRAKSPTGSAPATQEQQLRHDLRTPLNVIKGYGEMLREDIGTSSSGSLRADLDHLLETATDLLQRLDRIGRFSVDAEEMGSASNEADAVVVSDLIRSLGPIRHEPNAVTETGSILVVDDIEANRDLLSRRLTRDGHRVVSVAGGQQALQALADGEFDLVLLDLMMPDINGFDVLVRMKADERLRRIPVIMVTALAETESAVRCIEAGAEDYLPKPFNRILLRARINACLNKKRWRDRERKYLRRIEDETAKFERLLLTILPKQVIGRLNHGERMIADRFEGVSVLFADLVGFTEHSARVTPAAMVEYLNRLFSEFDALARELGVEKIKTIGDAYMAVAGLPTPSPDPFAAIANMALGMIDRLGGVNGHFGWPLQIRIGIHSGPVVAGIIGTNRFIYDVWGDTVNVASRLEAYSLPNRIHVSQDTARHLVSPFALEPRGSIDVKGKGKLETFFLSRI
ncbi:adenylate/guanylate cyclase domain-containing protein [Dongia soli]|uniref:histidine kinase n=1 Tax=Dongia soli TaxID=600628 RepID=A0ABU5EL05_9PROT|nr:adenylate/guanylate cyclase domain-containing protein [Dongia soli]MDY0885783.1 adenylate/guanylate cyclase domain-containing protein [Dongia soli]